MHTNDDTPRWDGLITDATLCTLSDASGYGLIEHAALGWKDGTIVFAGPMAELPAAPERLATQTDSAGGALVTPGLIDCHTHLVFAGDRSGEFEQRLQGVSYEAIARAGGGIASSVRATRAASEDALLASALPRARALLADGVTTIEIKSGYGLDTTTELKMLRVARRIGVELGVGVRTTFLGAHALPSEFHGRGDDYITLVCEEMLPAMVEHGLADAVDGFCETIGFSPAQIRRVFERARALGLPLKLHAEQLSYQGGARLAAEYGALSADHVEHATDACARAMAQAGTVAVLLPGAYLCMRETLLPPIDCFRAHGVAMAVATDCNPGTSPLLSLRLALGLACAQFRLTPIEALRGATVNAAKALGLDDRGVLVPGKRADMVRWNVRAPAELCYWLGGDPVRDVWLGGQRVPAGTQARRA